MLFPERWKLIEGGRAFTEENRFLGLVIVISRNLTIVERTAEKGNHGHTDEHDNQQPGLGRC